jgi:cytochrome c oxidase assembly factor CtaG
MQMHDATQLSAILQMAGMGLLVSVLAPALVRAGRRTATICDLTWPAWVALPGFVALHGALTVVIEIRAPALPLHVVLDLVLLLGAVIFWAPVFGAGRHRLDDAGRCVYLFLAAPALDLAGVVVVARGDSAGGLAMIVGMLPLGLMAVFLTWRWLRADEARAAELDRMEDWYADA